MCVYVVSYSQYVAVFEYYHWSPFLQKALGAWWGKSALVYPEITTGGGGDDKKKQQQHVFLFTSKILVEKIIIIRAFFQDIFHMKGLGTVVQLTAS